MNVFLAKLHSAQVFEWDFANLKAEIEVVAPFDPMAAFEVDSLLCSIDESSVLAPRACWAMISAGYARFARFSSRDRLTRQIFCDTKRTQRNQFSLKITDDQVDEDG